MLDNCNATNKLNIDWARLHYQVLYRSGVVSGGNLFFCLVISCNFQAAQFSGHPHYRCKVVLYLPLQDWGNHNECVVHATFTKDTFTQHNPINIHTGGDLRDR